MESWLDCKYGKYFENQNKVYLRDSVVVINTKGDTLKTSELWWDQINKTFYTDKPSEYLTRDKKIYPQKGITAAQDFSNIKFNVVTGEVQVKDSSFPSNRFRFKRNLFCTASHWPACNNFKPQTTKKFIIWNTGTWEKPDYSLVCFLSEAG
ncbi:MAG: LPS export ABC transporter periplasmic protein LptC [Chitinophagaceae bacterium]|nr:LPS export ABC transporter periplasmic protein LptC [Chitinophagaceae bacterium]